MSEWDDAVADVNDAVFELYGRSFTYVVDETTAHEFTAVRSESKLDEPDSPGRYCQVTVRRDALPVTPTTAGMVTFDGASFDIVEVVADAYQSYVLLLRKAGE